MELKELYKNELPDPNLADPSGLLFVSEGFDPALTLTAYMKGVFPWTDDGDIVGWYSPVTRPVITRESAHVPRRIKRYLRTKQYRITVNECPNMVIYQCSQVPRKFSKTSWITERFIRHYDELIDFGYVLSVEVWNHNLLIGGLFGLVLEQVFFGESMFSVADCASNYAFAYLIESLLGKQFVLIDCQVTSDYLTRFGAVEIPRRKYIKLLQEIYNPATL